MPTAGCSGSQLNFIRQQGLAEPSTDDCRGKYSALVFQPRLVGATVFLGVVLQSAVVFGILAAVLWWSAVAPQWNPFDALYNATLGHRPGHVRLSPAPGPRRFAQGMAGAFAFAITICLLMDRQLAARVLEAVFLAAVFALGLGSFCLGSFVFHIVRGRADFACRTLPWRQES